MNNNIKIILIAVVVIFGANGISYAMSCDMGSHKDSGQASIQNAGKGSKAVDVGNKICPVTGEKIKDSEKATCEYNGKIYNFCCSSCISDFKNDPEKYKAKAEQSTSDGHSMHESHSH